MGSTGVSPVASGVSPDATLCVVMQDRRMYGVRLASRESGFGERVRCRTGGKPTGGTPVLPIHCGAPSPFVFHWARNSSSVRESRPGSPKRTRPFTQRRWQQLHRLAEGLPLVVV